MTGPVILVPLDGSKQAMSALPVAKVLGEIERATLHILHIGEHKLTAEELRSRLGREAPALDGFTLDARVGTPDVQILRAAKEMKARAIVICKHSGAERGKMLGRTAMKVLHEADCPVFLVPPERGATPWHLQHVLVPHDGTPSTSAALQPAAELADRSHAELLVVHVTELKTAPAEAGSLTTPRYVDQPQHEWPAWSAEFLNRLACLCPLGHLHVRMFLSHGDTAAEVLRLSESQSTDLIVLAWRGIWQAPRARTLKDILREARCPIMVVRT
jgi:nucleotide-binding universal stress UspA family protein